MTTFIQCLFIATILIILVISHILYTPGPLVWTIIAGLAVCLAYICRGSISPSTANEVDKESTQSNRSNGELSPTPLGADAEEKSIKTVRESDTMSPRTEQTPPNKEETVITPSPDTDDGNKNNWRCACEGGFLPPGLLKSFSGAEAMIKMGAGQCYHKI